MRIMGIDYGTKRIGIALSDELALMAHGADTIESRGPEADIMAISEVIKANAVSEVVVGLPLSMDGTDSEKTRETRDFIERLSKSVNVPVKAWDERLTSVMAERTLLEADISRQKRRKLSDKLAAKFILQGYLDSKRK